MKYSKYDVVIIGSGLAGLFLANKLSANKQFQDGILVVTKEELFSGSSALAQGGIVSVIPEINKKDSFELHIKDTLKAGCGLNNLNTVQLVSKMSSSAIQDLISFGVEFDKNEKNVLNFTLEGAHSCPRILHCKGDSTGHVIEEVLSDKLKNAQNVDCYCNTMAHELLIDNENTCRGVIVFNWKNKDFETIYSNNVILATGGIGQIYKNTTNPSVSTADGIALASRAGAELENMEFVQFHPTALFCEGKSSMPLVSESVRGEGAKLRDINGEYFAKNYHPQADLAPRDVVARAIKSQMELTKSDFVYLDISQIGIEKFKRRFPTITSLCLENNIDLSEGLIPVVPVEHYFMGGIKTDLCAKTSINNLYAIGECASTGLHGANRLASNSLLECVVFANLLFEKLKNEHKSPPKGYDEKVKKTVEKYSETSNFDFDYDLIRKLTTRLKATMSANVAIVRSKDTLDAAYSEISNIDFELSQNSNIFSREYFELKNLICCAKLVISAALKRENSIGAHYRSDYNLIDTKDKQRILEYDQILAGQLPNR